MQLTMRRKLPLFVAQAGRLKWSQFGSAAAANVKESDRLLAF